MKGEKTMNMTEKKISSKEIYKGKVLHVAEDKIMLPNGKESVREIVHHKEHLTPENINTPEIALGEDNLELLCRDCHALAHASDLPADRGLMFDEDGNLVERELLS